MAAYVQPVIAVLLSPGLVKLSWELSSEVVYLISVGTMSLLLVIVFWGVAAALIYFLVLEWILVSGAVISSS